MDSMDIRQVIQNDISTDNRSDVHSVQRYNRPNHSEYIVTTSSRRNRPTSPEPVSLRARDNDNYLQWLRSRRGDRGDARSRVRGAARPRPLRPSVLIVLTPGTPPLPLGAVVQRRVKSRGALRAFGAYKNEIEERQKCYG